MVATAEKQRILVVEDEPDLRILFMDRLRLEGYDVRGTGSGTEAIEMAQSFRPAVVLLDLLLDGLTGWQVCAHLRRNPEQVSVRIIVISALSQDEHVMRGFAEGADDFIRKPCGVREVVARVRSVIRRERGNRLAVESGECFCVGPMVVDTSRHSIELDGESLVLTATEFRLLSSLASNAGRVLSRQQLVAQVSDHAKGVGGRTIDVHIRALRIKLGSHAALLDTVRGVGYRLVVE